MNISNRIQSLRKAMGLSQEELGNRIGVSRQAISKWESNVSAPDIDNLLLLSEVFSVSTDYLLKGTTTSDKPNKKDAMAYSTVATCINYIALLVAIIIWVESLSSSSILIGMIIQVIGVSVFLFGQLYGCNALLAKQYFLRWNSWVLIIQPLSCIHNYVQLHALGNAWYRYLSPIPIYQGNLILFLSFGVILLLINHFLLKMYID